MPLPQDVFLIIWIWVLLIGQISYTPEPFLLCLVEVPLWAPWSKYLCLKHLSLWALALLWLSKVAEHERRC